MSPLAAVTCSLACVLLLSCTRGPAQAPAEEAAQPPAEEPITTPSTPPSQGVEVRWFGALSEIMHEGRTDAAVTLGAVLPGPHTWGVGALEGLAGEVTILDDVAWLARPNADGTATLSHGAIGEIDKTQGAALLVVANVEHWDELRVSKDVSWSELDGFLESELVARGVALDRPVPLRIDGQVASLQWHVVDGAKMQAGGHHAHHSQSSVRGTLAQSDAQLVGFFSRAHQGVFTHAGSYSHFHVLTRDEAVSGHVDGVDLVAGGRLLVPRR